MSFGNTAGCFSQAWKLPALVSTAAQGWKPSAVSRASVASLRSSSTVKRCSPEVSWAGWSNTSNSMSKPTFGPRGDFVTDLASLAMVGRDHLRLFGKPLLDFLQRSALRLRQEQCTGHEIDSCACSPCDEHERVTIVPDDG